MRGPIFDRSVELSWLDEALRLRRDGGPDAKAVLEMWMRDRIDSSLGREKTVRILSRVWLQPEGDVAHLIRWAVERAPSVADSRPLHIGGMLLTHPFFGDVCAAIGRQLGLHSVVQTTETTRRIQTRWGDREVVHLGVKSVVRTLRALNALTGKPGRTDSRSGEPIGVPTVLAPWLAHALVTTRGVAELDAKEFTHSPELFMLDVPGLQPNGYAYGDVFTEGGNRMVFRPRIREDHPSQQARQVSLPGIRSK